MIKLKVSAIKRNAKWWTRGLSFVICCLIISLSGCSSIDCPVQNTVAVYYSIKKYSDDGELKTDTLKDTLWVWSRIIDGTDVLLLNRLVDKSSFALQVSYQNPEDTLIFYIADTANVWTLDTVWLKKNDIPHFESVDCSAHYFHELTAVRSTHEGIDTIILNNPSVTYDNTVTNLNIVFKPRPKEEDNANDENSEE